MNTSEQLNRIYKLYSEKKYSEAFVLVQEILKIEPQNIYAKRYENLLRPYLNDKSEVGKIPTVKGKNLQCPHCTSAISLSALNDDQKTKIRENNYENLGLKCPYCHTHFTLQKKLSASILGIKIGDQIVYNNKKYRAVGSVEYSGKWFEGYYSGPLTYLEWILLGEDNSYLYFSEGYFIDDGAKNYEFEFSEKIIPNFSINIIDDKKILISHTNVRIRERNIVSAHKIYGENSKVFQVGEQIKLLSFSYNGKDYVIEKEQAGRQSEAGIYLTESISKQEACEIFGKEYKIDLNFSTKNTEVLLYGSIALIILGPSLIDGLGVTAFCYIILFWILFGIYFYNKEIFKSKMLYIFIIGPFFAGFLFFILQNIFEAKQEISLQNIENGKKFQIIFENSELKNKQETGKKSYDYGGIETTYKERAGLEFSVKNAEDLQIIEKIKNQENISEEVKKIFSEKIYKLR